MCLSGHPKVRGLEWNVAVLPDPDRPGDEMTVDLAVSVHFAAPENDPWGSRWRPAAPPPLALGEKTRGRTFRGRYELGQGPSSYVGYVAETVQFEIGNSFSWFQPKSVEIFPEGHNQNAARRLRINQKSYSAEHIPS